MPITVRLARLDGGDELVILNAERLAEVFCAIDRSSVGEDSYDSWVTESPPDHFVRGDLIAINRTMRARSPYAAWEPFLDNRTLPWLGALAPSWDLIRTGPAVWKREECEERIAEALDAMLGPRRGLSVVTKALHIKRPRLIPVLDALVVEQLGGSARQPWRLMAHLRQQGRRNLRELTAIQSQLGALSFERSLVRILDALLWSSHPASYLYPMGAILQRWSSH